MKGEPDPNAWVDYVNATRTQLAGEFIKRREFVDPYMRIEKGILIMGYACGAPNDLGWEQLRRKTGSRMEKGR